MHIGIDPGLTGARAVLAADGSLVVLHDTPTLGPQQLATLRERHRELTATRHGAGLSQTECDELMGANQQRVAEREQQTP
jgi:hypothetical protein